MSKSNLYANVKLGILSYYLFLFFFFLNLFLYIKPSRFDSLPNDSYTSIHFMKMSLIFIVLFHKFSLLKICQFKAYHEFSSLTVSMRLMQVIVFSLLDCIILKEYFTLSYFVARVSHPWYSLLVCNSNIKKVTQSVPSRQFTLSSKL